MDCASRTSQEVRELKWQTGKGGRCDDGRTSQEVRELK